MTESPSRRPSVLSSARATEVERKLESIYRSWRGTPHQLGGDGRDGIDCSGFVQTVFRDRFAIALPRTTAAQVTAGRRIERSRLRAGDLVFFKPGSYPRHVGIYMQRGLFLHVSASKGVMISPLDEGYWAKHYWTARRIF